MQSPLKGKKVGFLLTENGSWVIEPTYDKAKDFDSGLAVVMKSKRWFYVNINGEEVLTDIVTDKIYDFNHGIAFVKKEKVLNWVNRC